MTVSTLRGRKLVEGDGFVADQSRLSMASVAGNVGMASRQRKRSALIVVKNRRHPAHGVVTVRAARLAVLVELPGVNIEVTILAVFRGAFERYFANAGRRLVARAAGNRAVVANEREIRFRVIETFCIDPRFHVVASLAAHGRAIGCALRHLIVELGVMWIGVAGCATPILKIERQYLIETRGHDFFVTLDARNDGVRAFERKSRLLMHGDRKFRPVKIIYAMAAFATILVRGLGELSIVNILVTIEALVELHLIKCIHPRRDVALRAFHAGMLPQ